MTITRVYYSWPTNQIIDPTREQELQCLIAAVNGDIPELTTCIDACECAATESELDHYRKLHPSLPSTVASLS